MSEEEASVVEVRGSSSGSRDDREAEDPWDELDRVRVNGEGDMRDVKSESSSRGSVFENKSAIRHRQLAKMNSTH